MPSVVYLVLAILGLLYIVYNNHTLTYSLIYLLYIGVWTWFLNFLCIKGHTGVSWFLVFLPIIFKIMIVMFVIHSFSKLRQEHFTSKGMPTAHKYVPMQHHKEEKHK